MAVATAKRQIQQGAKTKNGKKKPEVKKNIIERFVEKIKIKMFGTAKVPKTAQQTIPYIQMFKDGICEVEQGKYNKSVAFADINYQLAHKDDQDNIFERYCEFLNYFDNAISVQMSFINKFGNTIDYEASINIPRQDDEHNDIREEYEEMLRNQLSKGNNGLIKQKYVTFGIEAKTLKEAKTRLERIENDIINNFKLLGAMSYPLSGEERLGILHDQLHPDGKEKFVFDWNAVEQGGMNTKDFIAPSSFDFRVSKTFKIGETYGAVSFLSITAPHMSDKLLAELLNIDTAITVTIHLKALEQQAAIKAVKRKMTDINALKVDAQKKASRDGYDMDIMAADIITFSKETEDFLKDLQSNNERMFIITFTMLNTASTKQGLEDSIFTVGGIAQKYNCAAKRLDYQQEQGLVTSLAIGKNEIEIQRGLTTSSTAIYMPFTTSELFMGGQALYYGLNALSNNLIMADRKELKNPKGLYWKGRFLTSKKTQAERGNTAQIQPYGHLNWNKAMYHKGHTLTNHKQGKAQKSTKEVIIFYISLSKNSITKGEMPCRAA